MRSAPQRRATCCITLGLLTLAACSSSKPGATPDAGELPSVDSGTNMPSGPSGPPMTPVVTPDAGHDAGHDAGSVDAGTDAGTDAGQDAGDPCAGLLTKCAPASVACMGDVLVECAENADGCLVKTSTNCLGVGMNNSCDGTLATPACAIDPCKDKFGVDKPGQCVVDETTCSDDILIECIPDADGCPLATSTNCKTEPSKNYCNDAVDPPVCDLDPCIGLANPCLAMGLSCRGTELVDCQPNGDLCLVETVTDCTVGSTVAETCIPGVTPVCGACADDAACATAPECATNVFKSCADTDGDMCLNLVSEDCGGVTFTCNMASGCQYSGGEVCDETPTATLRAPGTFGPYMTTGGNNTYGGYNCPGLILAAPAAGLDQLFAVDVAPGTVVTVAFDTPFANAWLMLLTDCSGAIQAPASCKSLSTTSVARTNAGTTTERVYVVVDANAGSDGMYGLTVDVRSLTCGDGFRDGAEACDDGNIFSNDGCTPTCTLETGYKCTAASPSICTRRPTDGVCGNVMCDALPSGASVPAGAVRCCTPQEKCGIAYPTYYGAGCFEEGQESVDDPVCPDEASTLFFYPQINGCCRPDNKCGVLLDTAGIGCIERGEFELYSADGLAAALYTTLDPVSCVYP